MSVQGEVWLSHQLQHERVQVPVRFVAVRLKPAIQPCGDDRHFDPQAANGGHYSGQVFSDGGPLNLRAASQS